MKNLKKIASIIVLTMVLFAGNNVFGQEDNFDNIGIQHNDLLSDLLQPLVIFKKNHKSSDLKRIIKNKIQEKLLNNSKYKSMFKESEIKQTISNIPDFLFQNNSIDALISNLTTYQKWSKELTSLVKKDVNYISQCKSLSELKKYIDSMLKKENTLAKKEKNAYKAFLITTKYSAEFWYHKNDYTQENNNSKGGPYIFNDFLPNFPGWKIVLNDGIGALAGGITGGFIGALVWGGAASLSEAIGEM